MWLSLLLRRRRDPSYVITVSLATMSPEFNPTSVILCLSLKTVFKSVFKSVGPEVLSTSIGCGDSFSMFMVNVL